jgi:uncharacterized protein (TIGR03435 family)
MMRYLVSAVLLLTCESLPAQSPPARLQFEVASVKPATKDQASERLATMLRQAMRDSLQGAIPMEGPGLIRLKNWPLLDLIAAAYGVRATHVSGPAWLGDQGFDIEAKAPAGTRKEQLAAMMQSLLEERFGLKAHRESQTTSGYALVVGKNGPKLQLAVPPPASAEELSVEEQQAARQQQAQKQLAALQERMRESRENGAPLEGFSRANWRSISTEALAAALARFTDGIVIDETGLTGIYAVSIETWKNPNVPGGTIFDAVEKLGLKLEARKITTDKVVVDQVAKSPTAN